MERGLLGRGSTAFFCDAFAAQLWTINSFSTLREVFSQAETSLGESREEAETARARMEEAEGTIRAAQGAKAEALARAEKAERGLEEARRRAELEADNARAVEERLGRAETEIFSYQNRLHTVTLQVRGAEERAENAEEIARSSDARASAMEEEVRVAKEETAEAKRKAADAVTAYRQSPAYNVELADATAFAYDLGFKDCKLKVKQVFNLDGVESLEFDIMGEIPPSTPAEDNTAPTEP